MAGELSHYFHSFQDYVIYSFACITIITVILIGLISGLSLTSYFTWHMIFMTVSVLPMMAGIWSRNANVPTSIKDSEEDIMWFRRKSHITLMSLSLFLVLLGYTFIALAHSSSENFFGYVFSTDSWDSVKKVIHAWTGYVIIALMISQATMGFFKYWLLLDGTKSLHFHGHLGRVIFALVCVQIDSGAFALGWGYYAIILIGFMLLGIYYLGAVYPYPFNSWCLGRNSDDETKPPNYGGVGSA